MKEYKLAILESNHEKLSILLDDAEAQKLNDTEIKKLIKLGKDKGVPKIEATLLLKYKTKLDSYSTKEKEKSILAFIMELSQSFYCSSWNNGIEQELWNWGNGISEPNKMFLKKEIVADAKLVVEFGKALGLWAEWSHEQSSPKVISIVEWNKKMNK